jgi:uncharacterized protein YegP (UPF0339 family)
MSEGFESKQEQREAIKLITKTNPKAAREELQ